MTARYVRSAAAGSANGTSWANAFTTITAAFAAGAAGDTYYVAEDHAESSAANVLPNSLGTLANPTIVLCVDHNGSVPPVAADLRATAQVTATGSHTMRLSGSTYYNGIIFTIGDGALCLSSGATVQQKLENCSLRISGTTSSNSITPGNGAANTGTVVELINTTVSFANVGQFISVDCFIKWRNTPSALLGTIPNILFQFAGGGFGNRLQCQGVDFSAAGSGKTITSNGSGATAVTAEFIDCKTNAAVTLAAVPLAPGQLEVDFLRVGSGGVNYNQSRVRYSGTLVEETTIVRTGGASNGTTTISWKIATTANATWYFPFEAPPIAIWNDTTGSAVTATVEGIWGGGAVPNDEDIWIEVEYLGDASSPQGSFVSDTKATPLTATAGQTSSSETWGGSTTKFKLNVSFTPQQKGWILARVKAGKASSTFYVDPKVTLT